MNKVKIGFPNEVFVDGDQVILHIDRFQELLESERENVILKSQIESLTKVEQIFDNGGEIGIWIKKN